ncbi:RNA-binding protein [Niallia taxi]|uniref:RNA-binding protein n=1 Tax=Niallia taxi TaxID=2499688 RepID=A0A3S2X5V8_9BACI|nr:RNA-binding protein [Niallia taxi]RVT67174.1 RNA-binding protein [Niallia taxi]
MSIYQHFRPEEKEFIDQVINWRQYVEDSYAPKLTDFLDPREQKIVNTIIGQNSDVKVAFAGGTNASERKRALLYPTYYEPTEDDFQLSIYEIAYAKKFVTLEHPQVLGSIMSLGLSRSKFGDILIKAGDVQLIVCKEVEDYIRLQLESIGKAKVELKLIEKDKVIALEEEWVEMSTTLASLRLDATIAAIYNISRQKAHVYIASSLVKVNWAAVENASFSCEEGDVISVRGHGRSVIKSLEGKTKKDKWRVVVGKLK